ncbi:MAG: TMEM165/GDT1 family protein [Proteobacteria bacterium]|nr:TMEM165/GDT1 family protein [Pseudomonadota bacterium]
MLIAASVFLTLLIAELGDKTQLATLVFTAGGDASPWAVFAGASAALIASSGLAVLIGHFGARYLEAFPLPLIAGALFVLLGVVTIVRYLRA